MMANVNEFFENLGKTFGKTADRVARKTDEFVSVQKVKSRRNSLENQMNAVYRNIGKSIFHDYAKGSPVSEDIAKLCEKIKKIQKEIDACTSEIADIRGETVCDSCGNPIPDEADFCMKCGNPKPEDEDIEDADFQAAEPEDEDEEAVEAEADPESPAEDGETEVPEEAEEEPAEEVSPEEEEEQVQEFTGDENPGEETEE